MLFHHELTATTNVESGFQAALVDDTYALQCVNGVVACSIAGSVGTDADALNAGRCLGYGNIQRGINAAVLCRVVDTIRRKFRAILHEMRAVGHQVRAVVVAADGPNGGWRAVLRTEGLIFVIVVIVPIVAVGDVVAVARGLRDEGVSALLVVMVSLVFVNVSVFV